MWGGWSALSLGICLGRDKVAAVTRNDAVCFWRLLEQKSEGALRSCNLPLYSHTCVAFCLAGFGICSQNSPWLRNLRRPSWDVEHALLRPSAFSGAPVVNSL